MLHTKKESHVNSTLRMFVSILEGTVLSKQGCPDPLNTDVKPITSDRIYTNILN